MQVLLKQNMFDKNEGEIPTAATLVWKSLNNYHSKKNDNYTLLDQNQR